MGCAMSRSTTASVRPDPPCAGRSADERAATLATRQYGVVSRRQLLGAGLTARQIDVRLGSGRLRPLHRGVYALGHLRGPLLPDRAAEMAAWLASGPGTVVSHRNAAWLWGLVSRPSRREPVHVTAPPGRAPTRRPGIRAHRCGDLSSRDVAAVTGIPVTAPLRTLCDLATVASEGALERAIARAEREGLVEREAVENAVARRRGRIGVRRLRAVVAGRREAALTRSEAEARFLALVRRGDLPEPEANVSVHGYEVDFFWRLSGVGVEVDGFAFHRSRRAFAADRRRDAELMAAGVRVMRITWEQIVREPVKTVVILAQALALRPEARAGR